MSLTITSTSFVNDGAIPVRYTCEGKPYRRRSLGAAGRLAQRATH